MAKDNNETTSDQLQELESTINTFSDGLSPDFFDDDEQYENHIANLKFGERFWNFFSSIFRKDFIDELVKKDLIEDYTECGVITGKDGIYNINENIKSDTMNLLYNSYSRNSNLDYNDHNNFIKTIHDILHSAYDSHPQPIELSQNEENALSNIGDNDIFLKEVGTREEQKTFEGIEYTAHITQYTLNDETLELIGEVESPFGQDIKGDS